MKVQFKPTSLELGLAYLAFVLGSDLPDLDSSNAPLRGFTKSLLIGFGIFAIMPTLATFLRKFQWSSLLPEYLFTVLVVVLSMVCAAVVINLFLSLPLFSHRGFAHSLTFGALYALLIYVFTKNEMGNPIFLALAGFFGVFVHLLTDYYREPWRAFKFK